MAVEIELVCGDVNYLIEFTIYNADEEIVDLNNVSEIIFKYRKYGTASTPLSLTGEVTGADTGKCQFTVAEEFVDAASIGKYKAEIQITYSTGQVLTAPNISLEIISDLR